MSLIINLLIALLIVAPMPLGLVPTPPRSTSALEAHPPDNRKRRRQRAARRRLEQRAVRLEGFRSWLGEHVRRSIPD